MTTDTQNIIKVIATLSITTLNTECHYAECHLCGLSFMLNVAIKPIMLSVFMQSVTNKPIMLCIFIQSDVMLNVVLHWHHDTQHNDIQPLKSI